MEYKLGKLPANPNYGLRLCDYVTTEKLPPLPTGDFGHQNYVSDWKMLGNGPDPSNPNQIPGGVGDCAIAGPFHAEMLWNAVGGRSVNVDAACTVASYSAITGYVLGDSSTDKGSSVDVVSNYWQTTGLTDADGKVHKIDAWARLSSVRELLYAIYLTDCVGIGVEFPRQWMTAVQEGGTWEVVNNPDIVGGHYILGVGWVSGYINVITWGQQQLLSPAGFAEFSDEAVAYFSRERLLSSGKDLNGLNLDQLISDFQALPNL